MVSSKSTRIQQYEWLPTFCYECGVIGHNEFECERQPNEHGGENIKKQYGEWLRVSPLTKKVQKWKARGLVIAISQPATKKKI